MSDEKELENKFQEYQQMAKGDKSVDAAALMMKAMETQAANRISGKQKKWGYLISIALPPIGLIFALKFYFSGKSDGKRAALICVILTTAVLLFLWLIISLLVSSSGLNMNQIQQIHPQDIRDLLQ